MFVLTWCSFHLALDRLVFIPLGVGSLGVPLLGVGSLGVHSQHQAQRERRKTVTTAASKDTGPMNVLRRRKSSQQ